MRSRAAGFALFAMAIYRFNWIKPLLRDHISRSVVGFFGGSLGPLAAAVDSDISYTPRMLHLPLQLSTLVHARSAGSFN